MRVRLVAAAAFVAVSLDVSLSVSVCCVSQSVFGVSSVLEVVDAAASSRPFLSALQQQGPQQQQQQQRARPTAWQQVVRQIVRGLQSSNPLLREAACKAGADVLKSNRRSGLLGLFFAAAVGCCCLVLPLCLSCYLLLHGVAAVSCCLLRSLETDDEASPDALLCCLLLSLRHPAPQFGLLLSPCLLAALCCCFC